MTVRHYYNEFDPFAAQWLRGLIAAGHLPPGDVDERSIVDVSPSDLDGYTQCHFFAGIGGWPLAIRWAGLEHVAGIWTGSCPCQPLSSAGKRQGHADERHLWPAFHRLIAECAPAICFGEQVASKDGREWFAGVRFDLEDMGYACGAADLCAASVGAPHIRQRLFWVADAASSRRNGALGEPEGEARNEARLLVPGSGSATRRLADAHGGRREGQPVHLLSRESRRRLPQAAGAGATGGLEHAASDGREPRRAEPIGGSIAARCELNPWLDSFAIICAPEADGRRRWRRIPTEPEIFPLAPRLPGDVGRLRGAGNAIVPQVAVEFIAAWLDAR